MKQYFFYIVRCLNNIHVEYRKPVLKIKSLIKSPLIWSGYKYKKGSRTQSKIEKIVTRLIIDEISKKYIVYSNWCIK